MSISYLLQGTNAPLFQNVVGFTSSPSNSNGWYEDVDSGLIRIEYEFEGIGTSLLAATNSFTTQLPFSLSSMLAFRGSAVLSSMSSSVLGGVQGNVTAALSGGVVTLSVGFPLLSSLSGLGSAKIGLNFSAQVAY
jgi:hypothetical protein